MSAFTEGRQWQWDLQIFAEEGQADPAATTDPAATPETKTDTKTETTKDPEPKESFNQDEVNKIIQERLETERRKLAKEKAELEQQHKEQIKLERKEAEELAKMSEEERLKVEKEKEAIKMQSERAKLEKEKADFNREKMHLETEKILIEKGLNPHYADYVMRSEAEATHEAIQAFETMYKEDVSNEVNERLRGKPPVFGNKAMSEMETLQTQLDQAVKSKDLVQQTALTIKLHELQQKG